MTTTLTAPPQNPATADVRSAPAHHPAPRLLGAALTLGVAYIHIKDQGGFPGDKAPTYVGIGYYLLEVAGLVAAVALLVGARRHNVKAWTLASGVAFGALVGFVLSRGTGLPDYTDDIDNWSETLGVARLVVEGVLVAVAAAAVLTRSRQLTTRPATTRPATA